MKHKFTVQGRGIFPADMLRYDTCYPATSESAGRITRPLHEISPSIVGPLRLREVPRTVELISPREPTGLRWKSFGWTVIADVSW